MHVSVLPRRGKISLVEGCRWKKTARKDIPETVPVVTPAKLDEVPVDLVTRNMYYIYAFNRHVFYSHLGQKLG